MIKYIVFLGLLLPLPAAAATTSDYVVYAYQEAAVYGLNADHFVGTLRCEAHFNPNAISDTNDYGIAQINLPSHPEVTYAEAMSPYWSIRWAAQAFANGHATWYSCWNRLFS